jgi:hypothetical protein
VFEAKYLQGYFPNMEEGLKASLLLPSLFQKQTEIISGVITS